MSWRCRWPFPSPSKWHVLHTCWHLSRENYGIIRVTMLTFRLPSLTLGSGGTNPLCNHTCFINHWLPNPPILHQRTTEGISYFRCNLDKRTAEGIPYFGGNLENTDGSLSLYFICHCDFWCTACLCAQGLTKNNKVARSKIKDQDMYLSPMSSHGWMLKRWCHWNHRILPPSD